MKEKDLTDEECKVLEEYRKNKNSLVLYSGDYDETALTFNKGKLILKVTCTGHKIIENDIVLAKNKNEIQNIIDFLNDKINVK